MFDALNKEIKSYKKLLIVYASICLLVAVFCSPFFGIQDFIVRASETELVPASETISTLTDLFVGKSLRNVAGAYASVVGVSAEPFTAIVYLGLI